MISQSWGRISSTALVIKKLWSVLEWNSSSNCMEERKMVISLSWGTIETYCESHTSTYTISLRAVKYQDMAAKEVIDPAKLPPTLGALTQHIFRAYYQCTVWKKLNESVLDPSEWGWMEVEALYTPVKTADNMAPEDILKFIHCKCKSNCISRACSCRKNGLKCVLACTNCRGECENNDVRLFYYYYITKKIWIYLFYKPVIEEGEGMRTEILEDLI